HVGPDDCIGTPGQPRLWILTCRMQVECVEQHADIGMLLVKGAECVEEVNVPANEGNRVPGNRTRRPDDFQPQPDTLIPPDRRDAIETLAVELERLAERLLLSPRLRTRDHAREDPGPGSHQSQRRGDSRVAGKLT